MKRYCLGFAIIVLWFRSAGVCLAKIGLSSQFADTEITHLRPGKTYNIRELRNIPYIVKNRGDDFVDVAIEVLLPSGKLEEGYEPIPDPTWIQIFPDRHRMESKSQAFSDIIIRLPNDPKIDGHHYQAEIWAHTLGTGLLAAGVKTKLRLSLGPGPEVARKEKEKLIVRTLNFDLWPQSIFVIGAKPGTRYDVRKKEEKSIKVTNRADKPLELVLQSVPWKQRFGTQEGYEAAPDANWLKLKIKKSPLKVKPLTVEDVGFELEIPKEYAGKKLMFWVQASLPEGIELTTGVRIYVTVLEK